MPINKQISFLGLDFPHQYFFYTFRICIHKTTCFFSTQADFVLLVQCHKMHTTHKIMIYLLAAVLPIFPYMISLVLFLDRQFEFPANETKDDTSCNRSPYFYSKKLMFQSLYVIYKLISKVLCASLVFSIGYITLSNASGNRAC